MAIADRLRQGVARAARAGARLLGQELVARNFYSPVPRLEELPPDVFERRSELRGIEFDPPAYLRFLEGLSPYLREFEPPAGFDWDNRMYGPVEAELLYAIVRARKPRRILELGSGFSSLVIAAACRANAGEGREARYVACDPFPREFLRPGVEGLTELRAVGATDVPLSDFEALDDGDVLFVDTTHTVKLGGDVNYVVLDALPALHPGVIVHVHDVFLPYEYPRGFLERRLYWAEQYLLQAFLAHNPDYRIAFPAYAMWRERPRELAELVPSFARARGPGAFWIERR